MEQVTFVTDDKKDVNLLITIAGKLGIKKYTLSKTAETKSENKLKGLFKIIDAGIDVSNFGDPSSWQKETRKDRNFN